jgi:site-specific DNA recombinase
MVNKDAFSKWTRTSASTLPVSNAKNAVIYTRVSSKEQADKNLSLEFQRRIIDEYAAKNNFTVLGHYGGTYESAKTDGRKEFSRMLDFIKKNKGRVSHILVYTLDRFSRTGGAAIKIATDLREKYGVDVFAVTQPTDTNNPSGVLHQNIQFLFSKFDNDLRRQRAIAGTKEKLNMGIFCHKPPMGYDVVRVNGKRDIVINETGKKLRKAFEWKARGMKNEEIIERLNAMGIKIYKQKLSMIFSNPFYAGIIVHKTLEGKAIEGQFPKLVSQELFLKVNDIRQSSGGKLGVSHQQENEHIPLKVFMKCSKYGTPVTGYIATKRKTYYYKCRTKGCGCNKNAAKANALFTDLLATYSIRPELIEPLKYQLMYDYERFNQSHKDELEGLKKQLTEVQKKVDAVQEKYFALNEMDKETYDRFMTKYSAEKQQISNAMAQTPINSSNIEKYIDKALDFSSKLPLLWASSDCKAKEKLQYLVFPKGVVLDTKNDTVRTSTISPIFAWMAGQQCNTAENENGQTANKSNLSIQVGTTGFEPSRRSVTPRPMSYWAATCNKFISKEK